MTKTQAAKESHKLQKKLEQNAQKNRDAAARNAASVVDGSSSAPRKPIGNIETLESIATTPTGIEVPVKVYKATFNGEVFAHTSQPEALAWMRDKRSQWEKAHGQDAARAIARAQLERFKVRIQEFTSNARETGLLDLSTLGHLCSAVDFLEYAVERIDEDGTQIR